MIKDPPRKIEDRKIASPDPTLQDVQPYTHPADDIQVVSSISSAYSAYSAAALGLNTAANQLSNTAQKIAAYGSGVPGSDNFVQNVVDLDTEKTAFKASALVLKTANQTLGTLLDIFDTQR
jgi:hypothetical protein